MLSAVPFAAESSPIINLLFLASLKSGVFTVEFVAIKQFVYKSALEKLKVTTHVFKVGTYKSAVEPFTRDTMSDEAKEANKAWLEELWASYKAQVAERRGFAVDNFDETITGLYQKLQAVNGDMTQYALDAKLVDSIKSREEFRQDLIALVGESDKHSFNQIQFKDYQAQVLLPGALLAEDLAGGDDDPLGQQALEHPLHVDRPHSLEPEARTTLRDDHLPLAVAVFFQQGLQLLHALAQQCTIILQRHHRRTGFIAIRRTHGLPVQIGNQHHIALAGQVFTQVAQ